MNILDVVYASILGILLYANQFGALSADRTIVNSSDAVSVLTHVASTVGTICTASNDQCLNNGTPLAAGALTTLPGYMTIVPSDPLTKKPLSLNIAADTNNPNVLHWSLDESGKYDGARIANITVYSGGAASTPVDGTEYYLHYDPCLGSVFASTAAATTPIQCGN